MAQSSVVLAAIACASLFAALPAHGGRIHPDLEARLGKLPQSEALVPVIIELEERANPSAAAAPLPRSNRRGRGRAVVEALREVAARTQPPVMAFLGREQAQGDVHEVHAFWVFNGFAVSAKPSAIRKIAARNDVREVRFDAAIAPPAPRPAAVAAPASLESAWNIDHIGAPAVWALDARYNGAGVVIGSFDTGVDGTHPDLAPRYRGNHAISWFDPYGQHATPFDNNGHGTHTTGTALGGDASGYNIGVAPGARWIAAKGWSDSDNATVSAFHRIFEWFLAPGGDPDNAPHIVNNSWGQSPPDCYGDFLADVRALRAAGIFPAFASGNEGPGPMTALGPGNLTDAFSVGATDWDDAVAEFSSEGPSQCDGAIKPDISAPGVAILSTLPGDFYYELDGTSMATPHISGAAAVLLSIDPAMSVDDLESALVLGAVDIGVPGPDNMAGVGRLDLLASAGIVLGIPRVGIAATVRDALEAGAVPGRFTVTRSPPLTDALTVTYSVGGSATPGSDYVALPGTATFAPGVASVSIDVTPIDDATVEFDETVVATLTANPAFITSPVTASVRLVSDELLPDLVVQAFSAPAASGPGATLTATVTTRNGGAGSAPPTTTSFYLSIDTAVDASDVVLGSRAVPLLAAGASDTASVSLTLPAGVATGAYYLIAKADGDDAMPESQEFNNFFARPLAVGPDLTLSGLTVPGLAGAGLAMVVSDTTTNQGGSAAPASSTSFHLSTNSTLDAGDVLLGSRAVPGLAGTASHSGTTSLLIPAGTPTGTYYVLARADAGDAVAETSEINNTTNRVVVIGPDLTVNAFTAPATGAAGAVLAVTDTIRNAGGGASTATITRFYLSANTTVDAGDVVLGSRAVAALAPGATDSGSTSLTLPAGTASGAWYLIAKADGDDALPETQEFNNYFARALAIGSDLTITSFTVPGLGGAGLPLALADTVSNQGGSSAVASTLTYYLSTNAALDAGDAVLGSRAVPALAAGGASAGSTSVTVPVGTATGTYYVIAQADSGEVVAETSEGNNVTNRTIVIGPDVVVDAFAAPAAAGAASTITATTTLRNAGGGAAPATQALFYLSSNATVEAGDVLLGSRAVPALGPGASNTGSVSLTIPAGTASGAYYIIAKADGDDAVAETQEFNNFFARAIAIGADLLFTSFTVPAAGGAGLPLALADTIANAGGSGAGASTLTFYLSADAVLDASDVPLGSRAVPALAASASSAGSTTVTIPAGTATGSYHVVARADSADAVVETSESNNTASRPVVIGPDLSIAAFTAPATGGTSAPLLLTDSTRNIGGGAAAATSTRFYLSANTVIDAGDVLLGSRAIAALAPGAIDSGSVSVTIPAGTASGAYYLIARADGDDTLAETAELNNASARPITIGTDLAVVLFTVPAVGGAGMPLVVSDTTTNSGGSAAPASTTGFYLSSNTLLDAGDVLVGSRAIAALAPGASDTGSVGLAIPAGTATGSYYVIARADSGDTVFETSETNNTVYRAVMIGPDLTVATLGAPATAGAGASLAVTDTTRNSGGGTAPATLTRFYLSVDSLWDAGDVFLGSRAIAALAPGASDSGSTSVTIPPGTTSGAYYLVAKSDGDNALVETQEANNVTARGITVGPDLVVSGFTVPGIAGAGLAMTVSDVTTNSGGSASPASTTSFFLSSNTTLDAGDVLLGSRAIAALAPGASDAGSVSLMVPAGTAMGTYYVFARADADGAIAETNEANNTSNRWVVIGPDLVVQAFTASSSVAAGASLTLNDTIRNTGGGDSPATVTRYYLSTNTTLDAGDPTLGTRAIAALAPGASDIGSVTIAIPAGTAPGTYYLFAKADGDNALAETQEFNNTFLRPLTVTP